MAVLLTSSVSRDHTWSLGLSFFCRIVEAEIRLDWYVHASTSPRILGEAIASDDWVQGQG